MKLKNWIFQFQRYVCQKRAQALKTKNYSQRRQIWVLFQNHCNYFGLKKAVNLLFAAVDIWVVVAVYWRLLCRLLASFECACTRFFDTFKAYWRFDSFTRSLSSAISTSFFSAIRLFSPLSLGRPKILSILRVGNLTWLRGLKLWAVAPHMRAGKGKSYWCYL